jgi:hypothetical protein
MNPIFPLFTIASLYTTPVQPIAPQVYYISNLSETDGAKCGEYISVTPISQPVIQSPVIPIMPRIIAPMDDNDVDVVED